jgi:predicted nucleotidyltransferase
MDTHTPAFAISPDAIQAVANRIAQQFNPQKIILFGSHARGDSHAYSDVDLLVILDAWTAQEDPEVAVTLGVPHPFPMDILVKTSQQLAERLRMGDPFWREMLERGRVLYERRRA